MRGTNGEYKMQTLWLYTALLLALSGGATGAPPLAGEWVDPSGKPLMKQRIFAHRVEVGTSKELPAPGPHLVHCISNGVVVEVKHVQRASTPTNVPCERK